MSVRRTLVALLLVVPALSAPVGADSISISQPAEVTALAVSLNETGDLVGASASIEVRAAPNGSGHVFMDTRPLSGTDMQGSARIASRVAAGLTGNSLETHDIFFTVRSESPIVSGPSAGSLMTLAAAVSLQNANLAAGEEAWQIRQDVMATGTINPDGSIGPVGGILEKAEAAKKAGASTFVVPAGQATYTPQLPPEKAEHGEDPVNVTRYCATQLNITCKAASTIGQLVETATGRSLPQPDVGQAPSTAGYADTLGPRTRTEVDRAERVFETYEALNASSMPSQAESAARTSLENALDAYQAADQLWRDEKFYSAASKAFQAMISERQARLLIEYHERGESQEFLEATLEHASTEVGQARQATEDATVEGIHDLYTVGAAQQRVSEAQRRVDQAERALEAGAPVIQVAQQAAWAFERARTVHWWLELSEPFGSGPALPEDTAKLADEFLNHAEELIAYSESVQGRSDSVEQAREVLERAQRDQERDRHAAALVEAAEAQVLAALAIEQQGGGVSPSKVNASMHQAAVAIEKARELGVEPILPIAMFEFAGTTEDPTVSLRFYRTANVLAGISSVLTGGEDPPPSRFIDPEPQSDASPEPVGPIQGIQAGVAGWAIVGAFAMLATITLGLALARMGED